ncbi:Pentatricopeptide repeat-containing protein, chloroplastic [Erysiphe neolycopersici]|uniref:Pentatricopeptide repeat-containing protein, chloroplastic n=1 Tax=Erysiphe neolycopersici TaxID=212602 RepID=A0A420HWH1_9PEZI|nr:Pentatricopeptide repeat-containing protein, chloroplastic [Erysiphe neolycopersici]
MPIYSNIASTLARQGPRTLAYGYAQSFIAVTHPQVYASQNRSGLGRYRANKIGLLSSYQFQNVFHNGAQNTSPSTLVRNEKCDGGLDAYFEAWRKTHAAGEPEKEWTQFQFAKRIEWKSGSVGVENETVKTIQTEKRGDEHYIECADDNIIEIENQHGDQIDEVAALANVDVSENEIETETENSTFLAPSKLITSHTTYSTPQTQEIPLNENKNVKLNSTLSPRPACSLQPREYEDRFNKLSKDQKYGEIPAVFEAMLIAGVNPTVTAYNTLIESALQISAEKANAISKVLGIYSDMLRRNVLPDSITYQKILTMLASRILEVDQYKRQLEEKRARFGGIDFEGKFMLNSSEIKYATLINDEKIDVLTQIYDSSVATNGDHNYSTEMYHQLISACSISGRRDQMTKIFEHMKADNVIPMASTFCQMINGVTKYGELDKAVDYYNIYRNLAIDHDNGAVDVLDRQDYLVYASLIKAYVISDRMPGALKFYNKIIDAYAGSLIPISELIVYEGFVKGLIECGMLSEALKWAEDLTGALRHNAMTDITTVAADLGIRSIADIAFSHLLQNPQDDILPPTISMLALSVREGRVQAAEYYWAILSHPLNNVSSSFIEPTAMFAVAMIGSGKILEGLVLSENMFDRIRKSATENTGHVYNEVNEGMTFINNFMLERGIFDPRLNMPVNISTQNLVSASPTTLMCEDSFDPYSAKTDFKGSSIISDELDRASSRGRGDKLTDIMSRLKNIRSTGRHPRYAIYAKLISAAAREKRMDLVHEVLGMARIDIPLIQQYRSVRYGWISILDAMIGACLTLGDRNLAAQYHQELLSIGAVPTANTFGLYITTLKGCTKTFDEAADAIKIFNQAKIEGVKPSSFLYNALIGKLGKARRIDDCLYYFAEMRYLGIRPTSVTYGTIVNALCRVSDENLAESLFEEMESMPNYKPRTAPYNSLMQFFLNTKRDKIKVLSYFERMMKKGIKPTSHTYKLIVDAHATLDPINMSAAEAVLDIIRRTGQEPEAVHYSSLIHAKGCVMHDIDGAKAIFESVMADPSINPQACLYQALFEAMVSNHLVHETESILQEMPIKGVEMTPYIANTLIHGWTSEKNIHKAESIYFSVNPNEREPSTYDAMIRAYLTVENRLGASSVVKEMLNRNYPSAVSSKICELLGINHAENFK